MNLKNGAGDRDRTGDIHVGNVTLYHLSYTRKLYKKFGNNFKNYLL